MTRPWQQRTCNATFYVKNHNMYAPMCLILCSDHHVRLCQIIMKRRHTLQYIQLNSLAVISLKKNMNSRMILVSYHPKIDGCWEKTLKMWGKLKGKISLKHIWNMLCIMPKTIVVLSGNFTQEYDFTLGGECSSAYENSCTIVSVALEEPFQVWQNNSVISD